MTDAKSSEKSAGSKPAITIKKYANRRLYNTGTSTYVTLDDLATLVKAGEEFVVVDAKTGEDITRSVLTQIIFEQESRGGNMLPVSFLRQLIGYYGDQMQSLVPSYLDFTMQSLTREQGKLREQMTRAFGAQAMEAIEEQTRRNMAMFERAMRMFSPFAPGAMPGQPASEKPAAEPQKQQEDSGIDDLKKELADMQAKLDKLSRS
ncbi:MAG: polyhydroxyalkanoate synthesis repressor PhaR [Rhodobiaceae bacterium]|nr:polyhydroxyalkanoate synthesis repressor PhaR [Rhodobiaceae bacterium]MCC0019089.1 polyhydroxyalkanoate synthesis repressor PhaR [Rhodobiaceae bacterium]MCC0051937.1 polyhydroxyalkanoate synthesis repressor PhaR [Rhodobiaceae bacterium]